MTHKMCNGEESQYLWIFFDAVNNLCIGTSRVMKVVAEFHRNCVCGFGEESKYLFWGTTPKLAPLGPECFFNAVTKLWCILGD